MKSQDIALILIFALLVLCLVCGGCATVNVQSVPSLCSISPEDGRCWVDKANGQGVDLKSMAGWLAMSPDDLEKVITNLNRCVDDPSQ
jgi:hypothetical protein